jgi:D-inositol-3-phosphate glycosyltransferase
MRISLIGPVTPYRGGIAHFTTQLAKRLMDAGHDIQVVSFKKQYPQWLYPGESDKDFSPGRERVEAEYILTPFNPFTWRKTVRTIAAFNPDKVILPWWVTFWGPAFQQIERKLKKRGFMITILIHNTYPHESTMFDKWIAKNTLKHADHYIVMSEKERQKLIRLFTDPKNISIVPHPIYKNYPESGIPKEQLRDQLGIPPIEVPVLLFFGFIRPYKGLSVLLDATKTVLSTEREVHLIIAGEFWDGREIYDQKIEALGMREYVHIFDYYIPDDKVSHFFEAADIFVAPYTNGTQSGALKVALGFGLPAVVTEVVADDMVKMLTEQCVITKTNDSLELAQAILKILNKPKQEGGLMTELFNNTWALFLNTILHTDE